MSGASHLHSNIRVVPPAPPTIAVVGTLIGPRHCGGLPGAGVWPAGVGVGLCVAPPTIVGRGVGVVVVNAIGHGVGATAEGAAEAPPAELSAPSKPTTA